MKRMILGVALGALVFAGAALADSNEKFKTSLWGSNEVPPRTTDASGKFKLRFDMAAHRAQFELVVKDGQDITAAHIHCGPEGVNGPIVATLMGHVPGGFDMDGRVGKFWIDEGNIEPTGASCPQPITTMEHLHHAAMEGMLYANVHSVQYPNGAIRGQLWQD